VTDQRNQIDQLPAPRREMVPDTFGFSKVQPRFWRVPNSEWEPIRNAPGHGGLTPFRNCEMLDCKTWPLLGCSKLKRGWQPSLSKICVKSV